MLQALRELNFIAPANQGRGAGGLRRLRHLRLVLAGCRGAQIQTVTVQNIFRVLSFLHSSTALF